MIHFDFIVDEADAETIMSGIHELVYRCNEGIIHCMSDNTLAEETKEARIDWFKRHKNYLSDLQKRMKNTRIEK